MHSSIRLGRIAGIEIGLNWTWFFVFFLIAWTLAIGVFPNQNPGLADATYWAMGAVAAVLFFLSILLHELGHALQARRDDVEIDGITLWLFGGVAKFKSMYETPGAEFRIAIAGPLVTVVIAGALLALARLAALPAAVEGVVYWLGYINLLILVFNMLPALPLDGGRLLHSALWQAKRDLRWATQVAAGIGVAFGWLMIGGGIVLALGIAAFSGLWLALIGWFLMTAARQEAAQIETREALSGLRVRDLMSGQPVTIAREATLGRFMDEVASRTRYTTYPVVEGDRPVGLLTFAGVAERARTSWDAERVEACMIPLEDVPTVAPGDEVVDALQELAGERVDRALVLEGGRLVGMLAISDVARAVATRRGERGGGRPAGARGFEGGGGGFERPGGQRVSEGGGLDRPGDERVREGGDFERDPGGWLPPRAESSHPERPDASSRPV